MHPPLRSLVLVCHVTLMALLVAAALVDGATAVNLLATIFVVAPLLLMLRALAAGRRAAERWLAVLLVPYAGGFCVEVVARAGTATLLGAALIVVVLELGLLLALIRRPHPRAARE
jgi:Predicted membrane protein (DUF2069)